MLVTLLTVLIVGVVLVKVVRKGMQVINFVANVIQAKVKRAKRQAKRAVIECALAIKDLIIDAIASGYFALISKIEQ
jgi:hypothetical protein